MSKTFSSKSNAARAAAAFGLTRDHCFQAADGRWGFRPKALVLQADGYNQHTLDYLLEVEVAKREAEAAAKPAAASEPAKPTTGTPAYKDFQLYGRSVALSPVATVHSFLNKHGAELSRKDALFELSKLGVNYATARTQYQRWFSGRGK
jgi:hypothetical protein